MLKNNNAFRPRCAPSDRRLQEFISLGQPTRPRTSSEALAGPCGSEACGRGYNCCSPRLAGCSECSGSDLEQAVDENESGTPGQNERTMAGAVDRGDRFYV